jgi:hypothetical protein
MDIRRGRLLPHREARESEEEKHVCPLQLDVIERCLILWSNPGETLLSPFMGVGSEIYGARINGRRGIGIELKATYYRQAVRNVRDATEQHEQQNGLCFGEESAGPDDHDVESESCETVEDEAVWRPTGLDDDGDADDPKPTVLPGQKGLF